MEVLLGFFGIALVLVPIILTFVNAGRLNNITKRLQHLERLSIAQSNTIEELRNRAAASALTPEPPKPPRHEERAPAAMPKAVEEQKPVVTPSPPEPIVTAPQISQSTHQPAFSFSKPKARTNKEWEALIGGKILNRIGALALIIGIGFFLKYAFDNNWISETMRVLMGAAAGFGLLYGGFRSHKKDFKVFAQGLVGAGIATLYLSVYAAFNFYHLVPQFVAFGLMSCVTMLTLWVAWKYNSLAVALLGWAGGFLTPIVLSTGTANQIGLFTYLALLDAGLLAIVLSKEKWFVIEPLSLAGTAFMYLMWFDGLYTPDKFVPTLFFAIVFWILFFGIEAIRTLRKSGFLVEIRQLLGVAITALFFTALYQLFEPDYHWWMGIVTLLIAVPYFALFRMVRGKGETSQLVLGRYVLIAVALLFTATAIHFYGFTTAMLWSLEAVVVIYFGLQWNMKSMWSAAIVMFAFAFFKLFFSEGFMQYQPLEEFRLLLNRRALAFAIVGTSMLVGTELFRRKGEQLAAAFGRLLTYVACLVVFALISAETSDLFERRMLYVDGSATLYLAFKRDLSLAVVWMAYSLLLAIVGFRRNQNAYLHSSIVVLALSILLGVFRSLSFDPIEQHSLLVNYRVLVLIVLAVGCVRHAWWWRREGKEMKWSGAFLKGIGLSIVVIIFVLLTSEVLDFFNQRIIAAQSQISADSTVADSERIESYRNLQELWISGVWLFYSIVMLVAGIWKRFRALRIIAIILFGITILKIFIFDLSFLETLYRIISFMGLGVILLGVSYLYQKYKGIILDTEGDKPVASAAGETQQ